MLNVGLCIALKDITKLGDSIILPGDGASHTEVFFRYIVFRPTIGEVISGKIRSCSREGVHSKFQIPREFSKSFNNKIISVTLGFFDDILIPPSALQYPSRFEEAEQAWVWEYPNEEGGKHDLYMDIGETIKFRVANELFEESSPIGPPATSDKPSTSGGSGTETVVKIPYKIEVKGFFLFY